MIECYVGIVCISVATFKPFVRNYIPWLMGGASRKQNYSPGYGNSASNKGWSRNAIGGGGQRSNLSYSMSPWSKKKGDVESFDFGESDGRAKTTVSAHGPGRDVSTEGSDTTPRDSTDHIIRSGGDHDGIVKTTHVLVRDEENGALKKEKTGRI